MNEALNLQPRFRPVAEIAQDIAAADANIQAVKQRAKTASDGFKAQVEKIDADLKRLRSEYLGALDATR